MRKLKIAALAIFCAATPLAIGIGIRLVSTLTPTDRWGFSNGELVTTLLTGLTISIAVLAAVIALMAVWGYHAIKDEASGAAKRQAQQASEDYLQSSDMKERIKELARPIIDEELKRLREGTELAFSQPEPVDTPGIMKTGEEAEKVGEPYKKEGK